MDLDDDELKATREFYKCNNWKDVKKNSISQAKYRVKKFSEFLDVIPEGDALKITNKNKLVVDINTILEYIKILEDRERKRLKINKGLKEKISIYLY